MFDNPYYSEPSDETEEFSDLLSSKLIKIGFYKGSKKVWFHRFIRWWTKSTYSHVELLLDDETWVSISPSFLSAVTTKIITSYDDTEWDFLEFVVSDVQHHAMKEFVSETTGDGYDWIGMLLSQVLPVIIKSRNRWYCSSWVFGAMSYSGVIKLRSLRTHEVPNLSPGKLYQIITSIFTAG